MDEVRESRSEVIGQCLGFFAWVWRSQTSGLVADNECDALPLLQSRMQVRFRMGKEGP